MLAGKEIQWLYKENTDKPNTEPTIVACEMRDAPSIERLE